MRQLLLGLLHCAKATEGTHIQCLRSCQFVKTVEVDTQQSERPCAEAPTAHCLLLRKSRVYPRMAWSIRYEVCLKGEPYLKRAARTLSGGSFFAFLTFPALA